MSLRVLNSVEQLSVQLDAAIAHVEELEQRLAQLLEPFELQRRILLASVAEESETDLLGAAVDLYNNSNASSVLMVTLTLTIVVRSMTLP